MDRVNKYKKVIRKYLEDWCEFHPDEQTGIPLTIVEDSQHGHLQLLEIGHNKEGWNYNLFVHFQVKDDGRVILLANNTDQEPADELVEGGIAAEDIYVGWVPPAIQTQLEKQPA
ncbi:MAG: element excision factor XisI family protein [Bacteroidota bacterium]